MKIGDTIIVRLTGQESFRSKIIDMDESRAYINIPRELLYFKLNPDHACDVSYIENDVPHQFTADIEKYIDKDIPYFILKLPNTADIERIQRREYVRIQTDIDIAIYFDNQRVSPIVTVTQDISGGGVRAVLREALPFEGIQHVVLYMVLRFGKNRYEYVYTKAKTVRSHLEKGVHSVSMQFLLDDETIRQKIISYCFHVQRENRKHGIN